jgi:cell division protein FtsB
MGRIRQVRDSVAALTAENARLRDQLKAARAEIKRLKDAAASSE